ncbi:hypothetical protein H6F32_19380 [Anabaena sp. FACHB-1237]|uniref:hypothetical protein n=1 Tax=Anabaena sp. FACHB-1237 TaxID=2692769 RepID=UPI0016805810|nr:hypothetical protein [Anabaena sp. FACHB-1237]MBD2139665.1 hypothetical protein [Anabaena sp. FACHB-1237]
MLIILTDNQVFNPEKVCQSCLMANSNGQPRWGGGQLRCGQLVQQCQENQPQQYQCMMGFRLANI